MNTKFGFCDARKRFAAVTETDDALVRLDAVIDWAMFRAAPERIDHKERKSAAGRKPMGRVVMFKMFILQNLYRISVEALEYHLSDRLMYMGFLGIDLTGRVPGAKTVWLFRERLREAQAFDRLFEQFYRALGAHRGKELNDGQFVDASFVEVAREFKTREENETIKDAVSAWRTESPAMLRQQDVDAR